MKRTWLVVSVVAHLGLLGAYIVHGMWRIEKVSFERAPIQLAAMTPMGVEDPMAGLEPGAKPKDPPKPETKQITDDLVQPDPAVTPDPAATKAPAVTPDPNLPPGGGGGAIPGVTTTPGTGLPCLDPAGCKPAPTTPKPCVGDQCEPKKPPVIAPPELEKLRLTGETQIVPDNPTKLQIQRDGHDGAIGSVKLCIDTGGRVSSTELKRSTGYPAYDAKLLAAVGAWTFRPHTIGKTPIPVCTKYNFHFRMK